MQADVFYPITCGDAKATLIWKKFVCPGINVKCVQVYAAVLRNTDMLSKIRIDNEISSHQPTLSSLVKYSN